ncbi:MAG: hypothetical protein IJF78_10070 [Clostridia bacterium]|nr:hypothetical protein [Clostridia bacterium]
MRLLTAVIAVLVLLTSCGASVPETAEDVRDFEDLLAFMTGNPENTVTAMTLTVESAVSVDEPVTLSESDASRLLALLTGHELTVERYEPEHIYGGSWYTVTFLLADGGSVNLYPERKNLMVFRRELNEEQRWYDASYRLDTAVSREFYETIGELWSQNSDGKPATH